MLDSKVTILTFGGRQVVVAKYVCGKLVVQGVSVAVVIKVAN